MSNQNFLTITYDNTAIHSTTASQSFTLNTAETYCEHNIEVDVDFLNTSDANAVSGDILNNKTAYVNGTKITGNIPTKTLSDVTASGATIAIPAGYYASQINKTISSGSVKNENYSITAIPLLSSSTTNNKYIISISATQTIIPNVTTAGYITNNEVSSGLVTVTGNSLLDQSTISATSITPLPTSTTAVTVRAGYYPNDRTITINAMSSGTKANVSSEGTVSTTPIVNISANTTMVTATSSIYSISYAGAVSTTGIVQTKYKNTRAGYLNQFTSTTNGGDVKVTPTITGAGTIYIPAATITAEFSGGDLSVSATYSNITLAETDINNNGLIVTLNANRAATSLVNNSSAGYIPTTSINASYAAKNTTKPYYIQGINLIPPQSGTSVFSLTIPNGINDTMTLVFEIDKNSNVTIKDGDI